MFKNAAFPLLSIPAPAQQTNTFYLSILGEVKHVKPEYISDIHCQNLKKKQGTVEEERTNIWLKFR